MASYKVGILGATGAVGEQMRIVLAERKFPISELRLFGSARSAGKVINYEGQDIVVQEASLEAFKGLDLLLGAADNPVAKQFLPEAAKMGIHVVDNSSAFRLDPDVPLVIPEVNPEDVKLSKGLIANPNCATIIGLTAVNSLHRHARIRRMVVSTYQAVSGAGKAGIDALEAEVKAANGQRAEGSCFPYPIAYNLIPQIGGFNEMGYSSEEMKCRTKAARCSTTRPSASPAPACACPSSAPTPRPSPLSSRTTSRPTRPASSSPKLPASSSATIRTTASTRCRSLRATKTSSTSAACAATFPPTPRPSTARSRSSAAPTRSARAPRRTPFRSPSSSSA